MPNALVHIVLSDEGWILETLARKLKDNLSYVNYDLAADSLADIQYYMTYGTWLNRVSPTEIGYFAHVEQDPATQEKFYHVASKVDYAVCHSKPYEALLRARGKEDVVTIPPGVDLERFQPKVKIGVVGRTYHTGRKGEHLVAAVMDLPGIEWHFTGTGWPGPARSLLDDQMPGFYREMDYILVPSMYEGGPMSVIEALACGCQVIAPPVGWVPEYPHIEYRTGDVDDLRRVLTGVVEERMALRRTVLDRGWENWVGGHDRLFQEIMAKQERARPVRGHAAVRPQAANVKRPGLIIHGTEKGTDKGGPSVRAPRTALLLNRYGYEAKLLDGMLFDQRAHDLYHVYNLWHPRTCRQAIEHAKLSGAPIVLSPIFLDLSEKHVFDGEIPRIFGRSFGAAMINDEYARIRETKQRRLLRDPDYRREPYEGFHDDVCSLITLCDHLILLSEDERRKLTAIGADVSRATVVPNPVEPGMYAQGTPDLFAETYGVKDYVLCVGRLEARKNQITLLHALRDTGVPLVLIGHAANPDYEKLLRAAAGPNATFVGRIPNNSQMLASAYAGARVFCLPSWSEGAPLVALEAAAAGCNMVLSDRSSEQEYFGKRARYCDPGNPQQMRAAVMEAYEAPFSAAQRAELSSWTALEYSWEKHIEKTAAVYEHAFSSRAALPAVPEPPKIYIDLTSSAHRSGPPSGIARVEERYATELYSLMPDRVVLVLWNSNRRTFIEVSHDQFVRGKHKSLPSVDAPAYLFDDTNFSPAGRINFERGSVLLVLGGAWIRNENYVHSLSSTKRLKGLILVSFVHDVIQAKFQQWFPDKVGEEFAYNCRGLVEASDHIVVNSQCTLDDLREFCAREQLVTPPVDTVRFGDEIEKLAMEAEEEPQFDRLQSILRGKPFILCVSAIDIRKNHLMLYNIWERMLAEHGPKTPNLIMVGSKGWNIDQFLALVEKNPTIRNVFHIMNGINDATLDWLYRNCLFTVYPSLYEGWGLPVAEALNYGKVCIAAKAGSVPEIAPEMTDLIDPLDYVSWHRAITGYIFNPNILAAREAQISLYKPVTWKESALSLRDILLKISGQRRPLPSLRVGKTLSLDEATAKTQKTLAYKVGGWYNAEKKGTWTAGSVATLQAELRGISAGPLLLEISGYAFSPAAQPIQFVDVEVNGRRIGEMSWTGAPLGDLLLIPSEIAAEIRSSSELRLALCVQRPMSPESADPKSADKRLLGIMVSSVTFYQLRPLAGESWIDTRDRQAMVAGGFSSSVFHGVDGQKCHKVALLVDSNDILVQAGAERPIFVGFRFLVKGKAEAEIDFYAGGNRIKQCSVPPGKVESRFVAVTSSMLTNGVIVEIVYRRPGIEQIDLLEYGLFSALPDSYVAPMRLGTILDCTEAGLKKDVEPIEGSAASWKLGRPIIASRADTQLAFLAGWSAFERSGIWAIAQRAFFCISLKEDIKLPYILAFRVRPYQARYVDVRINGGLAHRWNFKTNNLQTKFLPICAGEVPHGLAVIEFSIHDMACPAEVEGVADARSLGIFIASVAILDPPTAALPVVLPSLPEVSPNTLVSFVTSEKQARVADHWNVPEINTLPGRDADQILMSGWSTPEKTGVWTDGDSAFLLFRLKPGKIPAGGELVLSFEIRPFEASHMQVRVNSGAWVSWWLVGKKAQQKILPLTADDIKAPCLLVEFRPQGVESPLQKGVGSDERRLGIFLYSFAYLDYQGIATRKREEVAAKRPAPLLLDMSAEEVSPAVTLHDWFEAEVHGRWSGELPGRIIVLQNKFREALRVGLIVRTLDTTLPQPQAVTMSVNGCACGSQTLADGFFQRISFVIPEEVVFAAAKLDIEFRCSYVSSPMDLNLSDDSRKLGVLVRSVVLSAQAAADPRDEDVPGGDLIRPLEPPQSVVADAVENVSQ